MYGKVYKDARVLLNYLQIANTTFTKLKGKMKYNLKMSREATKAEENANSKDLLAPLRKK
jgi:hypothetical protein